MKRTFIFGTLFGIVLVCSLTACGKRGDPYRPSDIPEKSRTQTPASEAGQYQ